MKRKSIRIILGLGMMVCFLNLIQYIYFLLHVDLSFMNKLLGMIMFYWMWFPSVMLIVLIYIILTRWFKYVENVEV